MNRWPQLTLTRRASADYNGTSETAKTFFATIQNKLLFAVTGHTAAELIAERADATSPTMGLTTWKGDRVHKADVRVSKNYLGEAEIAELNLLTTMFLDFAEDRARRRQQTLMAEWVDQTDRFIEFSERQVLRDAGAISTSRMEQVVAERYDQYDSQRKALEAKQSAAEELGDLTALTEIERGRITRKEADGH